MNDSFFTEAWNGIGVLERVNVEALFAHPCGLYVIPTMHIDRVTGAHRRGDLHKGTVWERLWIVYRINHTGINHQSVCEVTRLEDAITVIERLADAWNGWKQANIYDGMSSETYQRICKIRYESQKLSDFINRTA